MSSEPKHNFHDIYEIPPPLGNFKWMGPEWYGYWYKTDSLKLKEINEAYKKDHQKAIEAWELYEERKISSSHYVAIIKHLGRNVSGETTDEKEEKGNPSEGSNSRKRAKGSK
jgi:hypothetical protein